jgi:hypothetical protein
MRVGIIAEDTSDVEVVTAITLNLLRPLNVGFKHFVGNGCGKLRRKCGAWADILVKAGCPWIIVIHDLDKHHEQDLRGILLSTIEEAQSKASVVLLPRLEIEAWLLYDSAAIAAAFNESVRPKLPHNPELLVDPKQYLHDLVWKTYRKQYLSTLHNAKIAKQLDVSCLTNSASFSPHPEFVSRLKCLLKPTGIHRLIEGSRGRRSLSRST